MLPQAFTMIAPDVHHTFTLADFRGGGQILECTLGLRQGIKQRPPRWGGCVSQELAQSLSESPVISMVVRP